MKPVDDEDAAPYEDATPDNVIPFVPDEPNPPTDPQPAEDFNSEPDPEAVAEPEPERVPSAEPSPDQERPEFDDNTRPDELVRQIRGLLGSHVEHGSYLEFVGWMKVIPRIRVLKNTLGGADFAKAAHEVEGGYDLC